jgi:hypothetical protein
MKNTHEPQSGTSISTEHMVREHMVYKCMHAFPYR